MHLIRMKHLVALIFVIATAVGTITVPGTSYAVTSDVASVQSVSSVVISDACDENTALKQTDSMPCQDACVVPCAASSTGFFLTQSNTLTFIRPAENRVERTVVDALSGIISAVDLSPPRQIL